MKTKAEKIKEIKKLIREREKPDFSKFTDDVIILLVDIFARLRTGKLKKSDPELINVIERINKKYNCKITVESL
jgi:hypothetical protein